MARVAIASMGAVTAAGLGAEALWQGLLAGRAWIGPDGAATAPQEMRDAARPYRGLARLPRVTQMSCLAAAEAVRVGVPVAAGAPAEDPDDDEALGIIMGTCYANLAPILAFYENCRAVGPATASPALFPDTVLNAPAGHVAIYLGLRGPTATISCGRLSGLLALRHAADMIETGRARRIVACAGEALPPAMVAAAVDRPPAPAAPGEAAGAVVLAATGEGAEVRAAAHADTAAAAVERALAAAGSRPGDVGGALVAASGEPGQAASLAAALAAAFGGRRLPRAATTAIGDCLGAWGMLAPIVAARAVREGILPPTAGADGSGPLGLVPEAQRLDRPLVLCLDADAHGAAAALVGGGP